METIESHVQLAEDRLRYAEERVERAKGTLAQERQLVGEAQREVDYWRDVLVKHGT